MPEFLNLKESEQRSILKSAKIKCGLSWTVMARELEISRSMLFLYLNESYKLPLHIYRKLKRKFYINDQYEIKTIFLDKYIEKKINNPKMTAALSEFLGILAGDGHLGYTNYEVSVSGHRLLDERFLRIRVSKHFLKLFSIKPKIQIQYKYNKIKCFVYSKNLVEFLHKKYCVPIGKKINKLRIQKQILKDKGLIINYLRGLFDTDGSFYIRRGKDPVVEFITKDKRFLLEVKDALKTLGFNPVHSGKSIRLYRKKEVEDFFKVIRPSNLKHLNRHKIFKKTGSIPNTKMRQWSNG